MTRSSASMFGKFGRFNMAVDRSASLFDRIKHYSIKSESGCWEWTGTITRTGYAQLWWRGKMRLAHRMSYDCFIAPIPDGMLICHKCDNRGCVNPDHLFVGTQTDNRNDMYGKGRGADKRGERHHASKLTADDVAFIRTSGWRDIDLAKKFNVHKGTIRDARIGRNWKHI